MIDDTLARIEKRIQGLTSIGEDKREELAGLFSTLKAEVTELSKTEDERAESITRFAELSTHEATRAEKNESLQKLSADGLAASVDGFEASHPKLVEVVNSICRYLSNLGI